MFSKTKTGLKSRCKSCDKQYAAKYYRNNREKIKARSAEWKRKNYVHSDNPLQIKYHTEEERRLAANERARRWRRNNPEKARAIGRANSARRRAGGLVSTESRRRNEWEILVSAYGHNCLHPDCTESENLHMDHVVPLAVGGEHGLHNLQILCQFHNIQKGARNSNDYRPFILGVD